MRTLIKPLVAVIFLNLLTLPSPGFAQFEAAFGGTETTYTKDEVRRMLMDAGASSGALLDPYPSDYAFTEEEVRELLRSIPQEELLEELKRRRAISEAGERELYVPGRGLATPSKYPRARLKDDRVIRPFGYEVFAYSPLDYAPTEDVPVGPDYVLGPGDELKITLWGTVEKYYEPTVNREGNVVLPELGIVQASGITLGAFEEKLGRRFSRVYSGFHLDVSIGRLRTIQVFIVGDVTRPGAYTISSISTVFNALYYAGGPTERGSLRRVLVYRSGALIAEVDLYDYLLRGDNSGDLTLKSGDTVFVTTVGPMATVQGAVRRPAIYELAGDESVADAVELAGGFTAEAFPERVEITRVSVDAGLVSLVLDCSSPGPGDSSSMRGDSASVQADSALAGADHMACLEEEKVKDGDEITVYSVWHVFPKEFVSIQGAVQFPDEYPLYPGMRVSDLIFRAGGLLDQAYLMTAEVSRIEEEPEKSGLVSDLMFIDLDAVIGARHSEADILLERADKVFVRQIPGWRSQHLVMIGGEVRFPGTYTLKRKEERLSYLIERAGGLTPEAFPEAGSIHRRDEGRVIVDFARALDNPGGRDDIELVDGDSVHVPVYSSTIKVEGAVGRPGAIVFRPGKSANYYIDRTGGFLEQANKNSVRIIRLDGSSVTARKRFWFDPEVEPGNSVTVELKDPRGRINWVATIKDATAILASVATTVYIVTRIEK